MLVGGKCTFAISTWNHHLLGIWLDPLWFRGMEQRWSGRLAQAVAHDQSLRIGTGRDSLPLQAKGLHSPQLEAAMKTFQWTFSHSSRCVVEQEETWAPRIWAHSFMNMSKDVFWLW